MSSVKTSSSFLRDMDVFNRLKRELLKNEEYRGKFLAIYNGEIVGVDEDDSKLSRLIDKKYGNVSAYIGKVAEEEEIIELSSPELVNSNPSKMVKGGINDK